MYAFQLMLLDGDIAAGVLFDDGWVHVHAPISRSYETQSDMLEDISGSTMQLIGPFVMAELAKTYLDEDYRRAIKEVDKLQKRIEEDYQSALRRLKDREAK